MDLLREVEWFLMFQAQSTDLAISQIDGAILVNIQLIPPSTLGLLEVQVHFEFVFRRLDTWFK
jgi:hypothetical protein